MKLSLEIIKERLKNAENIEFFKSSSDKLLLSRPSFIIDQTVLKSHTLYIGYPDDLKHIKTFEKDAACICIGAPAKRTADKLDQLLVIKKSVSMLSVFNEIQFIYDQFDQWENYLLSTLSSGLRAGLFRDILNASTDFFENGLSIMDPAFHIVAQNEVNIKHGGYDDIIPLDEDLSVPIETLSAFKYDKDYQRISSEREIFYYEGDMLPHRVLCQNLFREDLFLYRIIITECIRPFRKTDEILLAFFSQFFLRILTQSSFPGKFSGEGLILQLQDVLESGRINRQAIESELQKRSWSYSAPYRVASVHVSQEDLYISSMNYYVNEIVKMLPESLVFPYHDSILIVINENRTGPLEQYSEALSVFVRENNFRIGISNYSDDIYKIQIMYHQAEMALSIGLVEKPMEWIHWFSRYTLQYIYNMLTNDTELGQLYSPIYYRLERYDKENGTSYLETLRVYLKCRMNTVQAAKELFIQRSTMIYRLKRIREITDNDLEDSDDLLHLYLTFSIIEREEKQKER